MPTLDDLRAAFSELERQAPVALSEPVRRSHRRRWTAVGLAAACTAAVAIAVPLATRSGSTPSGVGAPPPPISMNTGPSGGFTRALPAPAEGQSPNLTFAFAVPGTIAGYTVIPDQVTRTYQQASVHGPTDPPGGEVTVFYGGAFDPTSLTERTPVDVDGQPGYYATVRLPGMETPHEALVWQYADDGWAGVWLGVENGDTANTGDPQAQRQANAAQQVQSEFVRHNELELANALVPASDPILVPFRMSDRSGYVKTAGRAAADPDGGVVLRQDDVNWYLGWGLAPLPDAGKSNTSTIEIAGHKWIVYGAGGTPTALGLIADGFGLTLGPDPGTSLEQMKQFAANLELAPALDDPSTWFDAPTSLP